jgi:hypothetical protein
MEQPVLKLGLLGFSPAVKQKVIDVIAVPVVGWPRWELVDLEQADAWCVNGAAVQHSDGNTVRVRTLLDHQPEISLNPTDTRRPVAFTQPMPAGLEAVELVSFKDQQQLRVALQRFEAWLRPLRAQFALGSELIAREAELRQGIYHVLDTHGKLLAVLNLIKWTAALLPAARPVDFEDASWVPRPSMAADIPPGFLSTSVVQVMWNYAVRTVHDTLPARYRKETIYLRKLPQLPPGWLQDEHLVALQALSAAPGKFTELLKTTELPDNVLSRTLAALYYAGAVTTQKSSASQTERIRSPLGDQSSLPPDSNLLGNGFAHGHSLPSVINDSQHTYTAASHDATAPLPLWMPKSNG